MSQDEHGKKGEGIAKVRVQSDEITLERKVIAKQRLEERILDLKKKEEENKKSLGIKEKELVSLKEEILKLQQDFSVTDLKATKSGMIIWKADYEEETILYKGSKLMEIADENTCYIVVEDANQLLNLGDSVQVSYTNLKEEKKETTGSVAKVGNAAISSSLQSDYSYILLPPEVIADMAVTTFSSDGLF